ncbi:hypothetical protein Ddye_025350 [Dipteronia dyeriana]|uniref:Uncharacterized protein n=1 Tax=Dipteronia dyeriana TaxID=168575 RepID=A0AAD9TX13_9ROSI|nr:hypothetical protein Ddye_025350 [Dipteronia dyeriana]
MQDEVRLVTGIRKEIEKLTSNFRAIQGVVLDAEQKQLKDKSVRIWLDNLKDASYDMDDILDAWNTAILKLQIEGVVQNDAYLVLNKVCFFFCPPKFCFKQVGLRRDISLKIKVMNEKLDFIAKEKDMYNLDVIRSIEEPQRMKSTAFVDVFEVYGRDKEEDSLVSKLLSECHEEEKGPHIISIVGMGGIGKTTLAQLAFNNEKVRSKFEKTVWICVSDPFDEVRIAKAIIEALNNEATIFVELQSLLNCICESIKKKRFLLVLDDMWTEDYNKWGPFYNSLKNGPRGSKILVTTRKVTVAHMMNSTDVMDIEELSKDESWSLFKQLAFSSRSPQECEKLEAIGREIVGKCKGLPLAIKTIGSLLRLKKTRDQWQRILDSEMWKLKELEKDVFPPLLLSYNDLPSMVKQCFSYCVTFPKDYNLEKKELIRLWMAQGYLGLEENEEMEIIGEECFDTLVMHSLLQDFIKDVGGNISSCKMHDIVHDFVKFLVQNECFAMEIDSCNTPILNSSCEKTRHLMLSIGNVEDSFPVNISSVQKLRSLSSLMTDFILKDVFEQLTCLRALNISERFHLGQTYVKEIPKEVGKLIHLRYLNMSHMNIKELPETLCDLYNLQTLDVSYCRSLEKLPQGMRKLIQLRHLINKKAKKLSYMPKGIERLAYLRTLSKLVVGGDCPYSYEVCTLECLKRFNNLRGCLQIKRCGNVTNEAEVKNAELSNKKNLLYLKLDFDGKTEADAAVLESLELPPNLEKLQIKRYGDISMSSDWMVSFTQLKKLSLKNCMDFEHLPPLGKLSWLETLDINGMGKVIKVGNEFLGLETAITSSSSSSPIIAFPNLNRLSFHCMGVWEDWDYDITRTRQQDVIIMPCLSFLAISESPKLKALPQHLRRATLQKTLKIKLDWTCAFIQ